MAIKTAFNNSNEKLFAAILKPLIEENLSKEYHYQLGNLTEFQRLFSSLENKYAQAYAQAAAIENKLKNS